MAISKDPRLQSALSAVYRRRLMCAVAMGAHRTYARTRIAHASAAVWCALARAYAIPTTAMWNRKPPAGSTRRTRHMTHAHPICKPAAFCAAAPHATGRCAQLHMRIWPVIKARRTWPLREPQSQRTPRERARMQFARAVAHAHTALPGRSVLWPVARSHMQSQPQPMPQPQSWPRSI